AVAQTPPIAQPHAPRRGKKSKTQGEHADALADAVKRKIEVRMQQQPRRIGEHRNRGETQQDQPKKAGESSHQGRAWVLRWRQTAPCSAGKIRCAAATVASISEGVCAAERKPASK